MCEDCFPALVCYYGPFVWACCDPFVEVMLGSHISCRFKDILFNVSEFHD